jgi:hypothetical protein
MNPSCPHSSLTHGQLSYCKQHEGDSFSKTFQFRVKKLENKIVYYIEIETLDCQHLIIWPGRQGRVHCHNAKLKPNRRVTINDVPLHTFYTLRAFTLLISIILLDQTVFLL